MLKQDLAICIRKVDYSETSQIVTLFTRRSGKLSAIAKGSKRKKNPFHGAIEIFSYGNIVHSSPGSSKLATLTEFEQKPALRKLREKLYAMNCGFFAAELLNSFTTEHDPNPELFDSFVNFLKDVQEIEKDLDAIGLLIVFQLKLLEAIGTKPVIDQCVNCGTAFNARWPRAYFSSEANGLLCPDCEQAFMDKLHVSLQATACLANLKLIENSDHRTLDQVEKILIYHFTALLHKPPKMAKYFLVR